MSTQARDALIPSAFIASEKRETVSESEKHLLGQLFRRGPSTQAELTELLPLSQQSISRTAANLENRDMLARGARQLNGQRGQPSTILEINPDFAFAFGISLMADSLSVLLADFAGNVVAHKTLKSRSFSRKSVFASTRRAMASLLSENHIAPRRVFGIGVAITGFRVGDRATYNTPPTLEDFALVDLEEMFSEEFNLPVWVDNDGNTAALGENMTGVGRRIKNFAYFYIATGVGGGVIVDGSLLTGVRGNAGEFAGVLPIDKYPFPNLELLRQHLQTKGRKLASVNELVKRYEDSWPGIDEWIDAVAPSLSLMASATAAILDTEAIVIGGLIPRPLAERIIPRIEFFDIHRREAPREHAQVISSECDGDAAAIGAALLPFADKFFAL